MHRSIATRACKSGLGGALHAGDYVPCGARCQFGWAATGVALQPYLAGGKVCGNRVRMRMKLFVAITGASGAVYAQRLLMHLDPKVHELFLAVTARAREVIRTELPNGLVIPPGTRQFAPDDLAAPFASGSNPPDAMVIVPCSMGTLARIASGVADNLVTRTADVMLKERRPLVLVPRESPLNLIHLQNMERVLLAGARLVPAMPAFYHNPQSIPELVDSVVARVLDHLGIPNSLVRRWADETSALGD